MAKKMETEVKVGLFVSVGLVLIMASILVLGGTESWFTAKVRYLSHFKDIDGLIPGAKVVLGGVQVGTIETIELDNQRHDVRVSFFVTKDDAVWIRKDATLMIVTQGMLGDKFITVAGGTQAEPELLPGSEIPNAPSKNLNEFISQGDKLMLTLSSLAGNLDMVVRSLEHNGRSDVIFRSLAETIKNLSSVSEKFDHQMTDLKFASALKRLDSILAKIDSGSGTLGALVNDPGLYDDAKALMGGVNRNRIVRNLVRQTIKDGDKKEAEDSKPKK